MLAVLVVLVLMLAVLAILKVVLYCRSGNWLSLKTNMKKCFSLPIVSIVESFFNFLRYDLGLPFDRFIKVTSIFYARISDN